MNKLYRGEVLGGIGLLVVIAVTGFLVFGGSKAESEECVTIGSVITHEVTIKNAKVLPLHTTAKRCEKLRITNEDTTERLMAFGQHDKHVMYDGVEEKQLQKGQSLEVTLYKSGEFIFHDHYDDAVRGSFTVTK